MKKIQLPNTPELFRKHCQIKTTLLRNAIAEFAGTFLLLFIGTSVIAQYSLFVGPFHNWSLIVFGWGFGIMVAVTPVYHLSGGHLNPAVTALFFTMGAVDVVTALVYIIVQHLGAFVGAALTYLVYIDKINELDGGKRQVKGENGTAGIFSTYPGPHLSFMGSMLDQVVGTGMLAFSVLMIIDPRNKIPPAAHPTLIGLSLVVIGTAYGANCGYALNPARDLGPRIFTYFIYGKEVFTHPWSYWFIVPIVAPTLGALIGGWLYILMLGSHIPDPLEEMKSQPTQQDSYTGELSKGNNKSESEKKVPERENQAAEAPEGENKIPEEQA